MNSYLPTAVDFQALDFTSKMKNPIVKTEQPVLDLSCKKQPIITTNYVNRVQRDTYSDSSFNSSNEEQTQAANLSCSSERRENPFEVRSYMVTPPSEEESPKKPKFEQTYTTAISLHSMDHLAHNNYMNSPPIHIPVPILPSIGQQQQQQQTIVPTVPTILPSIIVPNSNNNNNNSSNHNNNNNSNSHLVPQIQMPNATSTTQDPATTTMSTPECKKSARPFKAYPKDPLSLSVVSELIYDQNSNDAYSEFRKKMLDSVRRSNEGTNIKMRRVSKSPGLPTSTMDEKDAAYWERRKKNNEAAKRSRDARRAKEDEMAIRAAFLEQENLKLKYELVALRNETAKLRCMIYSN